MQRINAMCFLCKRPGSCTCSPQQSLLQKFLRCFETLSAIRFTPIQQALPLRFLLFHIAFPSMSMHKSGLFASRKRMIKLHARMRLNWRVLTAAEKRKPVEVKLDDRPRMPLVREPAPDHQQKKTKVADESAILISRKRKRSEMEIEQE